MVHSYPRQNFGSTFPLVYPENNKEMMPRFCLGWERTMETNLIYASSGCPNNVDNSKQIQL